jgi:hypothetical protein
LVINWHNNVLPVVVPFLLLSFGVPMQQVTRILMLQKTSLAMAGENVNFRRIVNCAWETNAEHHPTLRWLKDISYRSEFVLYEKGDLTSEQLTLKLNDWGIDMFFAKKLIFICQQVIFEHQIYSEDSMFTVQYEPDLTHSNIQLLPLGMRYFQGRFRGLPLKLSARDIHKIEPCVTGAMYSNWCIPHISNLKPILHHLPISIPNVFCCTGVFKTKLAILDLTHNKVVPADSSKASVLPAFSL